MLKDHTRFQNIGRNINTTVRHSKLRKFFLQTAARSIYIQNRNYNRFFSCNFLYGRNRFIHGIAFNANQYHIRCFFIFFCGACFYRKCFPAFIPQFLYRQSVFSDCFQMFSSGNQCHVFSCFFQKESKASPCSPGSYDCIFHLIHSPLFSYYRKSL